MREASVHTGRT
jgi:hypothetical protein